MSFDKSDVIQKMSNISLIVTTIQYAVLGFAGFISLHVVPTYLNSVVSPRITLIAILTFGAMVMLDFFKTAILQSYFVKRVVSVYGADRRPQELGKIPKTAIFVGVFAFLFTLVAILFMGAGPFYGAIMGVFVAQIFTDWTVHGPEHNSVVNSFNRPVAVYRYHEAWFNKMVSK